MVVRAARLNRPHSGAAEGVLVLGHPALAHGATFNRPLTGLTAEEWFSALLGRVVPQGHPLARVGARFALTRSPAVVVLQPMAVRQGEGSGVVKGFSDVSGSAMRPNAVANPTAPRGQNALRLNRHSVRAFQKACADPHGITTLAVGLHVSRTRHHGICARRDPTRARSHRQE